MLVGVICILRVYYTFLQFIIRYKYNYLEGFSRLSNNSQSTENIKSRRVTFLLKSSEEVHVITEKILLLCDFIYLL